jgi:hypothetical protein
MRTLCAFPVIFVAIAMTSCGLGGFEAESKLDSVRILATKVDKPYAQAGDTVTMETLAVDARADKSRPMTLYWIPFPCINPTNDLYYVCFQQLQGGGSGGGGMGGGNPAAGVLKPGVDLSPFLPQGPTFSFKLPDNIIDAHPPVEGAVDKYGLAIVFNVACAGHIEITPFNQATQQQVPLGCFDDNHDPVGPNDYVIGLARVYAYQSRTNQNPTLDGITFQGQPIDVSQGIVVDTCLQQHRADCPEIKIDVQVPETSWELNPGDIDADGTTHHEEVWVDFYSTIGDFDGGARLLYDTKVGKIDDTANKYRAPRDPGAGFMYVVVHDNRGGVAWSKFPVYAK